MLALPPAAGLAGAPPLPVLSVGDGALLELGAALPCELPVAVALLEAPVELPLLATAPALGAP